MRVVVEGKAIDVKTIWLEGRTVSMIDQTKLPHRFEVKKTLSHHETAEAIRNMTVRGAGAIGVAAAYGMAQAALESASMTIETFERYMRKAADELKRTRPTAVNLSHAVDRCLDAIGSGSVSERVRMVQLEADAIAEEDLRASKMIGEHGCELIRDGFRILTHCNAGALAFIDYGTALSPMRLAHRQGKKIFVFVDETRPRLQGLLLTAWELRQEGIPHAVIADNAAGHFMRRGEIDLVIVGADRIAANGDVANKIGTYEKAVVAHENDIPFYVAAPRMTFDLGTSSGGEIVIEERGSEEVLEAWGLCDGDSPSRVRIGMSGTPVRNPAFDVTPSRYVTGFITEAGVLSPPFGESIRSAFGKI